jgi:hypothetical protein
VAPPPLSPGYPSQYPSANQGYVMMPSQMPVMYLRFC